MINFKNKKTIIITVVTVVLSISAISAYFLLKPKEEPKEEIKTISDVYKKAIDAYFDKDATKKTIAGISSMEIEYLDDVPFIKDGFLNEVTFAEENKGVLSDYIVKREKYIDLLHKKMKSDFKYKKTKSEEITERSKRYDIEFQGFQYMQYYLDLNRLTQMLLQAEYKNGDINTEALTFKDDKLKDYKINTYKAKTKAMELLNSQLKAYDSDETFTTVLFFEEKDKDWNTANPLEIYNAFSGGQTKTAMDEHDKRFQKILDKGYNKYINPENVLKLGKNK